MTDPATTQPEAPAASEPTAEPQVQATVPEQSATPDVESIVSARLAEWEEQRLKPLQRSISERDEEIRQLKTASLSEDEREQLLVEEEQREFEAVQVENWLLRKAQENKAAADLFERILDAEPDEQFAMLAELVSGAAAAPTPASEPEAEAQVPDVDLHNPAGASAAVPHGTRVLPDGTALTKEFRENFLRSLGESWPTSR